MALSLEPRHLKRYKDLVWLMMKYGRSDLVEEAGLHTPAAADDDPPPEMVAEADELASDLEALGPTFIKIGQLLSTRVDLLPPAYLESLARLQSGVEEFPFSEVRRILDEDLGVRVSKAFASIEETPLAAASIAQVHRAELRDGRQVVIKVQRPGIREQVLDDLEVLGQIAGLADRHTTVGRRYQFTGILEELKRSLLRELDFREELANLRVLGANLSEFEHIVVPEPVPDFSTARVLTMEYMSGIQVDGLHPVARLDLDGETLADELFHAYLQQILVDGLFHADPHPGNVFLIHDGAPPASRVHRLALLDLGMVGRLEKPMRRSLLQLLLSIAEADASKAADIAIDMGERLDNFDEARFRREIGDLFVRQHDEVLEDIEVGTLVLHMCRVAGDCGIGVPPELTLLGKTLLNLDQIGAALDPRFDPNAAVRRHASEIMTQQMGKDSSWNQLLTTALDTRELIEEMPRRVNQFLQNLAENQIRIEVDAIDEHELIVAMQKIANRITSGLLLAAMIIAAALIMDIETSWTLFGYPALALSFFVLAAIGGIYLLWQILFKDRNAKTQDERDG